ncbi:MAG: hypothetical protein WAN65_30375, partial [Candidatus Sulfotelmatobacter sp.]
SSRDRAKTAAVAHQFRPFAGYFEYGETMQKLHDRGRFKKPHPYLVKGHLDGKCEAPQGSAAGSKHLLLPPGGHPPIMFSYIPADKAWMPLNRDGKRMAFTAAYLGSHGWRYHVAA